MSKLKNLNPERVFKYFEDICAIPHGSGNMEPIAQYCVNFAEGHSLRCIRDDADNVIIYKSASKGYEDADSVILQAHLDMVCQKDDGVEIDFEKDGISIYADGDFIKAKGTTLGADNGIAVAMILAVLEDNTLEHPAIEAVFTTDEEIGMIGAGKLDFSLIRGTKMINMDSEDEAVLTVSCAGGSDFKMMLHTTRVSAEGKEVKLTVRGLKGGHSGVDIDKGRVNANVLMARILDYAKGVCDFGLISVDGGTKANAIPNLSRADIVVQNPEDFVIKLKKYADTIKEEIKFKEEDFELVLEEGRVGAFDVISPEQKEKLIFALMCAPCGVVEMSSEIRNLVETSASLGILKTEDKKITAHFALRSNKTSSLQSLEERLKDFAAELDFDFTSFGHYPAWEFKHDSKLQKIYKNKYMEITGRDIAVEAIHAGLECGVFAQAMPKIDCISVGPQMYDVHTPRERVSVSSVKTVFDTILATLKYCK